MGTLLEISDLTKHFRTQWTFRSVRALTGLSLSLREGEALGLIGHNGAGKTTTFKLLLGLLRPSRGSAMLLGRPSSSTWARRQIGFLPEQPYFYDYLTVRETLDFYADLCGLRRGDRAARIEQLAERLHLTPKLKSSMRSLSKGTLQRVGIAQAILHRPRLVILDEPMSGLDPSGRHDMRELIRSLKHEGTTVIFSSHILPDAEALCDRAAILARGELQEVVDLHTTAPSAATRFSIVVTGLPADRVSAFGDLAAPVGAAGDHWKLTVGDRDRVWEVLAEVRRAGGFVESMSPIVPSLEERFMSAVREANRAQ